MYVMFYKIELNTATKNQWQLLQTDYLRSSLITLVFMPKVQNVWPNNSPLLFFSRPSPSSMRGMHVWKTINRKIDSIWITTEAGCVTHLFSGIFWGLTGVCQECNAAIMTRRFTFLRFQQATTVGSAQLGSLQFVVVQEGKHCTCESFHLIHHGDQDFHM